MNQSKDMVITYNFGENKEELTGAVFTSWFTGSKDGQIQVDRNAAAAYIAALAAKYDTAGTARVFPYGDRQGCDTNRPVRLETQSGNRG